MFLMRAGEGNPLKLFERFGSHLLGYPVLLAVVFAVMYLLLRVLRRRTAVPAGKGGYRLITGNEMGIILLDYICRTRFAQGTMPADPVAVTTIVSTDMAPPVAKKYGVELRRTLTGFKFIGEQIGRLEAEGRADRYIFGFE